MQNEENYDMDWKKVFITIVKSWKIVLALVILMGAAGYGLSLTQSPLFEASALISFDASAAKLKDPMAFIISNDIKLDVAEKLNVEASSLPGPEISNSGTVYRINVQSSTPSEAIEIANTWADVSINALDFFVINQVGSPDVALVDLEKADADLFQYLEDQNLEMLYWSQLVALFGVSENGDNININIDISPEYLENLPPISTEQRLEIIKLMRARRIAETEYITLREHYLLAQSNEGFIVDLAKMPVEQVSPKTLQNIIIGMFTGVILSLLWVFIKDWWISVKK